MKFVPLERQTGRITQQFRRHAHRYQHSVGHLQLCAILLTKQNNAFIEFCRRFSSKAWNALSTTLNRQGAKARLLIAMHPKSSGARRVNIMQRYHSRNTQRAGNANNVTAQSQPLVHMHNIWRLMSKDLTNQL
jgi:hypothetical protein